ncbi:MAG TPA: acyl-CoA dehydrogenase family protein [Candidatus Dormibacteraeota bacterium]
MMGVSFELTDDQREIRDWVHDFAEREIRPVAHEYDEKEEFPWDVVKKAADVGLYGTDFLAQIHGDETGVLPALVAEELSWGCAGIALAIQGSQLPIAAIVGQGTPEQIGTWVPACFGTPDKLALGAFCATEPDAGSDVSGYKTSAVKKNGDWVLNGEKVFITNGGIADVHVVVASVDRSLGSRGQASFVVPPGTPGLTQGKKEKKLGIRASHTASVILNDVKVPADCLLGGEEKLEARLARVRSGESSGRTNVAMRTFEASRPLVGAQALGIARAAFEFALQYAKERKQFGKPIIENQAIAWKLADMAVEIEATRALIWRALWESKSGGEFKMAEGSMAKLKAGEVAVKVTDEAIQICGGYGYIREFPVEKWHRDAKIYTIFEGTSEIQRLVISRTLAAN